MLLHCQASPEGLVPAAPKVGQEILTKPFWTWNGQLDTPGVSSPEGNGYLRGTSLFKRLCSGGGDTSGCLGANTPPHLPVTQLRLCLVSYHISGAAAQEGCGMEIFKFRVAHQLFLHLSQRGHGSLVPPGIYGLVGTAAFVGGEPAWRTKGKDEGRIQVFSSLHMCCSSIKEVSWWELIPALEEILGVSKMILIHAVDPNHPLPRDQLVGEC